MTQINLENDFGQQKRLPGKTGSAEYLWTALDRIKALVNSTTGRLAESASISEDSALLLRFYAQIMRELRDWEVEEVGEENPEARPSSDHELISRDEMAGR